MKKILFGIIILACTSFAPQTSFEGKLTYKVEYHIEPVTVGDLVLTEDIILDKMKRDGEYFDEVTVWIKGGNYVKKENSKSEKRMVYLAEENKIYTLENDFEYVVIIDGSTRSTFNIEFDEPKIEEFDSTKVINGTECKLLKLSWGDQGEEYYFYNSDVAPLNPALFDAHKYEFLNEVINVTESYPLEIYKTVSKMLSIRMTLVSVSEESVDESLFELPEMKKANKEYTKMMKTMTGADVMEIK